MSLFVLPCPFCGALIDREDPVFSSVQYADSQVGTALICEECSAQGPYASGSHVSMDEEAAIDAWNRRCA